MTRSRPCGVRSRSVNPRRWKACSATLKRRAERGPRWRRASASDRHDVGQVPADCAANVTSMEAISAPGVVRSRSDRRQFTMMAPPIMQWDTDDAATRCAGTCGMAVRCRRSSASPAVSSTRCLQSRSSPRCGEVLSCRTRAVVCCSSSMHARESRNAGNAIFPECLKSELRASRSIIRGVLEER